jgi:hypothetical protein
MARGSPVNHPLLEIEDYVLAGSKRSIAFQLQNCDNEVLTAVQEKALQDYNRYLERARSGDGKAFILLCSVMVDTYVRKLVFGIEPFTRPKDWTDLVTRFVDSPSLRDYGYTYHVNDGFVRNYAANAMADRSLHGVKVSLAYCNEIVHRHVSSGNQLDYHYRKEVGVILTTELVKMKVELEREKAITY